MATPTCRMCSAELSKYTHSVDVPVSVFEPIKGNNALLVQEADAAAERAGMLQHWGKTLEIVRISKRAFQHYGKEPHISMSIWTGHWGYRGNDYFCTLTCGFRWALRKIKRDEE